MSLTRLAPAAPADFAARYEITQQRFLRLTSTNGFYLQEGTLVREDELNHGMTYCRALNSVFDEASGLADVRFSGNGAHGERADIRTRPASSALRATEIRCVNESGFSTGLLDLSIALRGVVRISN